MWYPLDGIDENRIIVGSDNIIKYNFIIRKKNN